MDSSTNLNILLVEDSESNVKDFEEYCILFKEEHQSVAFEYFICNTEEEAYKLLENQYFNAAIIDLNLNRDLDAGMKIIDRIHTKYRIPMIVFSGNASRTEDKKYVLKSIAKGKETYGKIIEDLYMFNRTGIMKILGKTGQLENLIDTIFWNNLHPKMSNLQQYVSMQDIEKDLLRYIVSHFNEILEEGVRYVFPEEMYIYPPINQEIKTGSILQHNTSNKYYIVMSPACDIQQGCNKFILSSIVEIETLEEIKAKYSALETAKNGLSKYLGDTLKKDQKSKEIASLEGNIKNAKNNIISKITNLINKPSNRYHFLSSNDYFRDSVIDFHDLITVPTTDINSAYTKKISITIPFLKDIQSRFSSYYARQGSPDLDISKIIDKYEKNL